MSQNQQIDAFLSEFDERIMTQVLQLREVLLQHLPAIKEELDVPARMIAYSYGRKYAELICMVIPSKKGLKLGFNQGVNLPDPHGLLEGTGKISRYVVIKSEDGIRSEALQQLILAGLGSYHERMKK